MQELGHTHKRKYSRLQKMVCLSSIIVTEFYYAFFFLTAPSSTPESVSASSVTSTSFVLSWNPPIAANQNGVIIRYVINVVVQGTGESFKLESTTTQHNISNLDPYRTYICEVAAATSVGAGPFSDSFTVQTLQDGKDTKLTSIITLYHTCSSQCCSIRLLSIRDISHISLPLLDCTK